MFKHETNLTHELGAFSFNYGHCRFKYWSKNHDGKPLCLRRQKVFKWQSKKNVSTENLNVNRNIQIPCEYSYFIYLYSKSRKCNKYRRLFTSGDSNLQPSYICHWLKGCISWIVPWSGTYKHYIEQLPFPQKPLESMKLGKFPMKKHFHKGP